MPGGRRLAYRVDDRCPGFDDRFDADGIPDGCDEPPGEAGGQADGQADGDGIHAPPTPDYGLGCATGGGGAAIGSVLLLIAFRRVR